MVVASRCLETEPRHHLVIDREPRIERARLTGRANAGAVTDQRQAMVGASDVGFDAQARHDVPSTPEKANISLCIRRDGHDGRAPRITVHLAARWLPENGV